MTQRWPSFALAGLALAVLSGAVGIGRSVARVDHPAPAAPPAPPSAQPFSLLPGFDPTNPGWLSPWRGALPGYQFRFPRDHAAHPAFKTEWWYYTGHLEAEKGHSFGFELTFFRFGVRPPGTGGKSAWTLRNLYAAHFAVTDETARRFVFAERLSRGALGMAGASSDRYRVWVDDWNTELYLFNSSNDRGVSAANRRPGRHRETHRLRAAGSGYDLDLSLRSAKPPAIHGMDGVLQKASGLGRASHYYSLTRLLGEGTLTTPGGRYLVRAATWMDHEFGSNQLDPGQVGWDWFSLQLDDGRELMLYQLRRQDGTIEPLSSGTLVERDGRTRHLRRADFRVRPLTHWRSPRTGGVYPARWRIAVPSAGVDFTVTPTVPDQELVTTASTGINYWEGSVRVSGTTSGRGYVELTGYAGRFRAPI
jgi:predicted secreted hydrolase